MEDAAPLKTFRISAKRRFVEPWMTTGLENAMQKNKSLYKETLKQDCDQSKVDDYKHHRNMLNRLKHNIMQTYYREKCESYKNNTKKLWQVINQKV